MGTLTDSSSLNASELKKGFGQKVRLLRKERGWSQKYLDRLSNIPWRTILDIEHADKAVLDHRTVNALSIAFELTGQVRREFFLAAGLRADVVPNPSGWRDVIQRFYDEHKYPAFITDIALYIDSFNSYLATLLNFSLPHFLEKHRNYGHITTLHFLFDSDFGTRELYQTQWDTLAAINIHYFRPLIEAHPQDTRYSLTLSQLQQMQDFKRIWDSAKQPNSINRLVEPVIAFHPRYGKLSYWHLQPILPDAFLDEYRAILNPPADKSTEEAFAHIKLDVPFAVYTLPVTT